MSLCTRLFLVTHAVWERFEFLIKRVGDSRSFPFPSRVFNYALLHVYIHTYTQYMERGRHMHMRTM